MDETKEQPNAPKETPRDISQHAVSLARLLDRLPPGKYVIELDKPEQKGGWRTTVAQHIIVREMWK
jgi:hypothetical protein